MKFAWLFVSSRTALQLRSRLRSKENKKKPSRHSMNGLTRSDFAGNDRRRRFGPLGANPPPPRIKPPPCRPGTVKLPVQPTPRYILDMWREGARIKGGLAADQSNFFKAAHSRESQRERSREGRHNSEVEYISGSEFFKARTVEWKTERGEGKRKRL